MSIEFACCVDLGAAAPAFVQLLPAGPQINGIDGRRWVFDQAAVDQVLAAFSRRNRSLVIDWEHSSQVRAEKGLEAPAAGWIARLEARGGELWGQVEWTPRGAGQIARREYRFLSPVFLFDKNTGRIQELSGAGLTNSPNLNLVALNRAEHTMQTTPLTESELAVCRALDLQPEEFTRTNLALNRNDGTAPPVANLLPAGPSINGLDGSRWTFDEEALADVLAAFERRDRPLVVQPEAGQIVRLEARERGELWGHVQWTQHGADQVARQKYRFISVSFRTEPRLGRILELTGARLTNDPTYGVLALNRAEHTMQTTPLTESELAICRSLDLRPEDFANTQVAQNRERTGTNTSGLSEIELAVCRHMGISPEQYMTGKERSNG